ncbi:MAG: peptidoglycan-binding protein, partial [Kiloniellaceae bacterium]
MIHIARSIVAGALALGLGLAGAAWPGSARAEMTAQEAQELEQLLARLNFDPGPVDGVIDERTRAAVLLYQEFAALPPDGQATAALLEELRAVVTAFGQMQAERAAAGKAPAASPAPPPAQEAAPAPVIESPPAPEP